VDELRALLIKFQLDEETLRRSRFDIVGAQLDVRVVPEGISRTEIARDLYEDYLETIQSS